MGYLLLAGGAEFGGNMDAVDRRAIELAGGLRVPISIIPTAAAPDRNDRRAGDNGVRWFTGLGASAVTSLPLIDRASANKDEIAGEIERSRLVYLLGGFPGHLARSLSGTRSRDAMDHVLAGGGVVGGSSAGGMVLCSSYFDPVEESLEPGLGLLRGVCLIPHHARFQRSWLARIRSFDPELMLLGIDEETGIINDAETGGWTVYGSGEAVIHHASTTRTYRAGMVIPSETLHPPVR